MTDIIYIKCGDNKFRCRQCGYDGTEPFKVCPDCNNSRETPYPYHGVKT